MTFDIDMGIFPVIRNIDNNKDNNIRLTHMTPIRHYVINIYTKQKLIVYLKFDRQTHSLTYGACNQNVYDSK